MKKITIIVTHFNIILPKADGINRQTVVRIQKVMINKLDLGNIFRIPNPIKRIKKVYVSRSHGSHPD